jgi:thiamine pyrophosphokinase
MRRVIIFANGELPEPAAVRPLLRPEDWIIAADGGTRHSLACGRLPHLVIGDLDSIAPDQYSQLESDGTEFLAYPADKDETDLELALLHAASHNAEEIIVLGALGGRLDQTLANVQLLARPELRSADVCITDGRQTARLVWDQIEIHGAAGDRISLIPFDGDVQGVRTEGLAWSLAGETLFFGQTRGVSNLMTGARARVQTAAGLLLCIHESMEA